MILKKITIALLLLSFLSGCAQNAALLAPAYTLASSGNVYQASFTYGSNEVITRVTGKSAAQNFKEALAPNQGDTDFQKLVKRNIAETRKKLNLSNQ